MLEVHDLTVSVFFVVVVFFQLFSRRAQTALHFCKNNNNKKNMPVHISAVQGWALTGQYQHS